MLKPVVKRVLRAVAVRRRPRGRRLTADDFAILDAGAVGGVALADLADVHGTPTHVIDLDRLEDNATTIVGAARPEPRAEIFYSYKTNPVPAVLRALHDNGLGAEVISSYEYWLARRLGVPADRIIVNGPVKGDDGLRSAISEGAALINANSADDARAIATLAAELDTTVSLGIRIAPAGGWSAQFGVPAASPVLATVVAEMLAHDAVDLIGIHAHRGGMIRSVDQLHAFVDSVLDTIGRLRERTGFTPSFLDLGGSLASPTVAGLADRDVFEQRTLGLPTPPPDPTTRLPLGDYAALVAARVHDRYAQWGEHAPRVVLEPGRAVTSDSQLLLTRVLEIKTDVEPHHVIVDAGVNIAEPTTGELHAMVPPDADGPLTPYRVVGPICTPADVIADLVELPRVAVGDLVAVMDAGAYFVPFATSFSFPQPPIVGVADGAVSVLRRRETYDDLIDRDEVDR